MYEQLLLHPYLHKGTQMRVHYVYHFWVHMQHDKAWRAAYKGRYKMFDKLEDRITNNLLPEKMQKMFSRVHEYRHDGKKQTTYDDDAEGMLEFGKNCIWHCNDNCHKKDRLSLDELEEAITSTFPELAIQIYNHCLTNNINLKKILPIYGLKSDAMKFRYLTHRI